MRWPVCLLSSRACSGQRLCGHVFVRNLSTLSKMVVQEGVLVFPRKRCMNKSLKGLGCWRDCHSPLRLLLDEGHVSLDLGKGQVTPEGLCWLCPVRMKMILYCTGKGQFAGQRHQVPGGGGIYDGAKASEALPSSRSRTSDLRMSTCSRPTVLRSTS